MKALYAPVAQLDRVTGYEPVGRGFESLPAYQKTCKALLYRFFCCIIELSAPVILKTIAVIISLLFP